MENDKRTADRNSTQPAEYYETDVMRERRKGDEMTREETTTSWRSALVVSSGLVASHFVWLGEVN